MTEWLDDEQQRNWRAFVEGSVQFIDLLDRVLRERHGVSLAEYEILVRLSEAPDRRMRMAELAGVAYYSRSRLSHAVGRLERRGWVRRGAAPEDRRGIAAELTDAGLTRLRAAAVDNLRVVREHFVDVIGADDLRAVGRAMRAVAARLPS